MVFTAPAQIIIITAQLIMELAARNVWQSELGVSVDGQTDGQRMYNLVFPTGSLESGV